MNNNFTDLFDKSASVADETIAVGSVTLRRFDTLLVFAVGGDATGKTPIELKGPEQVFGFINGLVKIVDHNDDFAKLTETVHLFQMGEKNFARRAGYKLVTSEDTDGLTIKRWHVIVLENGSHETREAINPVPYSVANTWRTEATKEENRHAHNTVNLHNGINTAVKVMAGTHSVSFKSFDWSDTSLSALNDKIRGLAMGKEFRDNVAEQGALRGALASEFNTEVRRAQSGKLTLKSTSASAPVMDLVGEMTELTLNQMVGLSFVFVTVGARIPLRRVAQTVEEAGILVGQLKKLPEPAYLAEVE